jgi:muramoyltetrapeptide carboxypeptidase LdcA involved in peptidoglycan recycling
MKQGGRNMKLIKPKRLKAGDKVATVSLSWGGAGDSDILWRYEIGKKRLEEEFGLKVVEMPHTLSGYEYIYNHPEKRAEDLMMAFKDPSIKGIFTCIGGDESVRILPYIDYDVIKNNPKVFIGYSDTTVSHFICLKAGISSFYGPAILSEFAENVEMFEYTKGWLDKVLFHNKPIGIVEPSPIWTSEFLTWEEKNKNIKRKVNINDGYELLQGKGKVQGSLIGGCIEVLEMIKETKVWPKLKTWENCILFFETSEEKPKPTYLEYWLRNYGSQGILQKAKGIIFGKPYNNMHYEEYKSAILKVVRDELKLYDLPILYNMNFGHTSPIITIPYGAKAEIDCENKQFSILESGVV